MEANLHSVLKTSNLFAELSCVGHKAWWWLNDGEKHDNNENDDHDRHNDDNDNDDHGDDFSQIQNGLIARSSCVGQ